MKYIVSLLNKRILCQSEIIMGCTALYGTAKDVVVARRLKITDTCTTENV